MIKVQKRKNFYVLKICFLLMYIKSDRFQLKYWDAQLGSAQLASQPSQLDSAQLGKFQLKLITK